MSTQNCFWGAVDFNSSAKTRGREMPPNLCLARCFQKVNQKQFSKHYLLSANLEHIYSAPMGTGLPAECGYGTRNASPYSTTNPLETLADPQPAEYRGNPRNNPRTRETFTYVWSRISERAKPGQYDRMNNHDLTRSRG